jgi:predicted ATPase/class 3 adenylate cyclase
VTNAAGTGARLTPYVSRLALDWAAQAPDQRHRVLEATFCFVDISGFTALSERLAKRGRIGAEELTAVLNDVFGELLGVAYQQAGTLVKFGGDALLLAFDGDDHAERGCWAAVGMRAALRRVGGVVTDAGNVRLRMSVGLHTGAFHLFRVGATHRELIVTGPAASTTTRMESAASAGEILASPDTADSVDPGLLAGEKAGGRLLRNRRTVPEGPGGAPSPPGSNLFAAHEVPVVLREHLTAGAAEPEHRTASVGFVKFQGTDQLLEREGPPAVAEALDQLVTSVQDATEAEQVTFLASDIDDNGGKIILTAGVPVTREDDEGRILRALRQVVEADLPLDVRAGVNRGHVFAGEVGSRYRRTYTVMGDTVNLAARLMARAPVGHLLSTASVVQRSRSGFETTELEPFTVKGKSAPVHALDVGPQRGAADTEASIDWLPFAGREAELDALGEVLEQVRAEGQGHAVEIVGAVGSGKSRLAREALKQAGDFGHMTVRGEPYGQSTPYLPVRLLLRRLLGADNLDATGLRARLEAAVDEVTPDLRPWLPLLGEVMALDLGETPEVAALEPQFRRERRDVATVELLTALLGEKVMLLVEDAHWLDEPSADLLRRLAVETVPLGWVVLTTTRPPGSDDPTVTRIVLSDLAEDAVRALVVAATDEAPLRPDQLAAVVERASGNPLFCEEILRTIALTRDLDRLPESLDAVASAGIDALPPPARRLLRYASVLGMTFRREALLDVVTEDIGAIAIEVRQLLAEHLVADDPETLRFRSRVLRDAAYEGLSYRRRRELHARAGRSFETRHADRLDAYAELLSIHFGAAGVHDKALQYARRAGDLAAAAYANVEAASQYELALESGRRLGLGDRQMMALLEQLGEVRQRAGIYEGAVAAFGRAQQLCRSEPLESGRLLLRQTQAAVQLVEPAKLIRWVRRAHRTLQAVPGEDAARLRAEARAWEAIIRRRQGQFREAARLAGQAVDDALASGALRALADAYGLLDSILAETGRAEAATYGEKVVEIFDQLGDRYRQGSALGNYGFTAYFRGDWAEARALYDRAVAVTREAGSLSGAAFIEANIGELLVNQGHLAEAKRLLGDAYRTLRAASDLDGAGFAAQQLGRIAAYEGRPEEADRYLAEARSLWEGIGDPRGLLELDLRQAEAMLLRGNSEGASLVLAIAGGSGAEAMGLGWALDRLDALRLFAQGRADDATDVLRTAVDNPDGGDFYGRYRLLSTILELDAAATGQHDALARERDDLVARLGIVSDPAATTPPSTDQANRTLGSPASS